MGEVYKATDLRDSARTVALKILPERTSQDPQARTRFLREISVAANLTHPNIVVVYDWDEHEGRQFFVMEFLAGVELTSIIEKPSSRTLEQKVEIAFQVCEALDYAHAHGVTHRDVKPANIMILRAGRRDHVKLLDFGIVHVENSDLTRTQSQPGTSAYMSPEQIENHPVDARSDLFSLGIVLYELFTGKHPFEASNAYYQQKNILENAPEKLTRIDPTIPAALETLVLRLLEKEPSRRPRSASDVSGSLEQIRRDLLAVSQEPRPGTDPGDGMRRAGEALEAGDLEAAIGHLVEILKRWPTLQEAGSLLDRVIEIKRCIGGIPYQEYRQAITSAAGALRQNDLKLARDHASHADSIWPGDREVVACSLSIETAARQLVREAQALLADVEAPNAQIDAALATLDSVHARLRTAESGARESMAEVRAVWDRARSIGASLSTRRKSRDESLGHGNNALSKAERLPKGSAAAVSAFQEAHRCFLKALEYDPACAEAQSRIERIKRCVDTFPIPGVEEIGARYEDLKSRFREEGDENADVILDELKEDEHKLEQIAGDHPRSTEASQLLARVRHLIEDVHPFVNRAAARRRLAGVRDRHDRARRMIREGQVTPGAALLRELLRECQIEPALQNLVPAIRVDLSACRRRLWRKRGMLACALIIGAAIVVVAIVMLRPKPPRIHARILNVQLDPSTVTSGQSTQFSVEAVVPAGAHLQVSYGRTIVDLPGEPFDVTAFHTAPRLIKDPAGTYTVYANIQKDAERLASFEAGTRLTVKPVEPPPPPMSLTVDHDGAAGKHPGETLRITVETLHGTLPPGQRLELRIGDLASRPVDLFSQNAGRFRGQLVLPSTLGAGEYDLSWAVRLGANEISGMTDVRLRVVDWPAKPPERILSVVHDAGPQLAPGDWVVFTVESHLAPGQEIRLLLSEQPKGPQVAAMQPQQATQDTYTARLAIPDSMAPQGCSADGRRRQFYVNAVLVSHGAEIDRQPSATPLTVGYRRLGENDARICGLVEDPSTGQARSGLQVVFVDGDDNPYTTAPSDSEGRYSIIVRSNLRYTAKRVVGEGVCYRMGHSAAIRPSAQGLTVIPLNIRPTPNSCGQ